MQKKNLFQNFQNYVRTDPSYRTDDFIFHILWNLKLFLPRIGSDFVPLG